jgi:hypothetical protein
MFGCGGVRYPVFRGRANMFCIRRAGYAMSCEKRAENTCAYSSAGTGSGVAIGL